MRKNAKDEYIGKVFPQNCGYNATVIDYKDANHIVVQFDDENKTIRTVAGRELKRGSCCNTPRKINKQQLIGQVFKQNCGYNAKILAIDGNKFIVQFDDEKKTTKTAAYYDIKTGRVSNRFRKEGNDYIGSSFLQKCGYTATVISYKSNRYVTVQLDDADKSIRENVTMNAVKAGIILLKPRYDASFYEGKTYPLKNGLCATILHYKRSNDIEIVFDDLDKTTKTTDIKSITYGTIAHPQLSYTNKDRNFYGYYVTSKPMHIDDETFYFAKEIDTGEEVFMTP